MLKIDNLTVKYGNRTAIESVNFSADKGEFIGIIGPNGSGKSTLLKTISGYLRPSNGSVLLYDKDVFLIKPKELARYISFVPEETITTFSFSVKEIILMGRYPYTRKFAGETIEDIEIAKENMRLLQIEELSERDINELSTGERQRVIIARALCQQSEIVLMDEPTAHLDISHQIEILDIVKRLNIEKKLTIIMVMHDLNLASEYCDRIALLDKGSVYTAGKPEDVITYQNIENIYKTVVVVNKNPVSGKPHVLSVPQWNK